MSCFTFSCSCSFVALSMCDSRGCRNQSQGPVLSSRWWGNWPVLLTGHKMCHPDLSPAEIPLQGCLGNHRHDPGSCCPSFGPGCCCSQQKRAHSTRQASSTVQMLRDSWEANIVVSRRLLSPAIPGESFVEGSPIYVPSALFQMNPPAIHQTFIGHLCCAALSRSVVSNSLQAHGLRSLAGYSPSPVLAWILQARMLEWVAMPSSRDHAEHHAHIDAANRLFLHQQRVCLGPSSSNILNGSKILLLLGSFFPLNTSNWSPPDMEKGLTLSGWWLLCQSVVLSQGWIYLPEDIW